MELDPITISETDRLIHARKLLFEHDRSSIVVLDKELNNIGIVTEGSLGRAFAKFRDNTKAKHQSKAIRRLTVISALKPPINMLETDKVAIAAELMISKGTRAILVVNENEDLTGLITKKHMIELVKNKFKA